MTTGHLRLCASALAILAPGITVAHAQDSAADTASEAPANGEIIVTAQKRSESVQNVPISIAAFSGASLDKQNVVTVLDLGKVATNFQTVRSSNTGSTRIGQSGPPRLHQGRVQWRARHQPQRPCHEPVDGDRPDRRELGRLEHSIARTRRG